MTQTKTLREKIKDIVIHTSAVWADGGIDESDVAVLNIIAVLRDTMLGDKVLLEFGDELNEIEDFGWEFESVADQQLHRESIKKSYRHALDIAGITVE